MLPWNLDSLFVVWGAYLLATASPGPSNMAILALAMRDGRGAALRFSAGVICGSLTWAVLAASGLSAVLATWAWALVAIKIAGGLYLLWLAWRSARSAWRGPQATAPADTRVAADGAALFRAGLLLHLTNPKAILSWLAIIALVMGDHGSPLRTAMAIAGCGLLGIAVFGGYALLFSTPAAVAVYRRISRWIDGAVAAAFAFAGVRLLTSRP